jgi:polyisoprenoid-binding protein YceI
MANSYTYDPDAWPPTVAGLVAGAIAAIVAALVSLPLRSPDEIVANSLSIVIGSLVLGFASGMLWRRVRLADNAHKVYGWTMAGGFVVTMMAASLVDVFFLDNVTPYAAPLTAIIFLTLGFLVPLLAGVTAPVWLAAVPVLIALGLGVGLFGRGNVASGELSLDDIDAETTTTQVAGSTTDVTQTEETPSTEAISELSGDVTLPGDLAPSYTATAGIATYTVKEILQGLSTEGVGESESVEGTFTPNGSFTFTLDLQSFTSDQSRRDGKVRDWFADFSQGTFTGDSFDLPPLATVGEAETFELSGDLTVNAITLPATWTIEARLESNGSLSMQGETDIVLSVYDVPVISSGFVTMTDAAHIEILLSAVPTG